MTTLLTPTPALTASERDIPDAWMDDADRLQGIVDRLIMRDEYLEYYQGVEWAERLIRLFPTFFIQNYDTLIPFAPYHQDFWEWVSSIQPKVAPDPFLSIWGRGAGKSTNAEAAVTLLGCEGVRKYCAYVCATQESANKHVGTITTMLESDAIEKAYPEHGQKKLGKFKQARSWNVERVRTEGGFTVDGVGLNEYTRGAKMDEDRPDLIILDDIDDEKDSMRTIAKHGDTITQSILPMASQDATILFVQNIPHDEGQMAQLVDGKADYLSTATISGPYPTIEGLVYETRMDEERGRARTFLTGGKATWAGMDLAASQILVDRYGIRSFLIENQHKRGMRGGQLWTRELIEETRVSPNALPAMKRIVVGVDPATSSTPKGSKTGIYAVGLGVDDHVYVLRRKTDHHTPGAWAKASCDLVDALRGDGIVGEKNNGGEMVGHTIHSYNRHIRVELVSATRGKYTRAEPVLAIWEEGRGHIVGQHAQLEDQMCRTYDPDDPSETFDDLDAMVWAVYDLCLSDRARSARDRSAHPETRQQEQDPPPDPEEVEISAEMDELIQGLYQGRRIDCTPEMYVAIVRPVIEARTQQMAEDNNQSNMSVLIAEKRRLDVLHGYNPRAHRRQSRREAHQERRGVA
ncbi:hypothetical protein LCGC14_1218190 [marine sediment metagenome]|uniref:Terminase large subunit gp17-like C-terminal domain-containing protein n=1 Tax=marine sediment metagenome TaxID=412755 RepID=A0A0F9PGM2_9ZZZZ